MKHLKGFEGLYTIAKDYTIIEVETGDIVAPVQDARGELYVKLKTEYGNTVRRKLKKLYREHYTEEGIDNENVEKIKELYNSGVLNARVISKKLELPLADVQLIVMEVQNENRED